MIVCREIEEKDSQAYWDFLNFLDEETAYMMYEPGERRQRTNARDLEEHIRKTVIQGEDLLIVAEAGSKIVGFLRAERGEFNRIHHTAYVVVGILKEYCGKGIGTTFFKRLETWAKENGILRLKLTVECPNQAAKRLYEKNGFEVEGRRRRSMLVNGEYVDEYYMSKCLF